MQARATRAVPPQRQTFAVIIHEGAEDAPLHLPADAVKQVGMQHAFQQLGGEGEDHRRLGRKEIHHCRPVIREGMFFA